MKSASKTVRGKSTLDEDYIAKQRDRNLEQRKKRNAPFVTRLIQACDACPECPVGQGRQKWVIDRFNQRAKTSLSAETVRKWFHGEARPSRDKVPILATVLHANATWLETGDQPDSSVRDEKRKAVFSAAVHLIAGFILLGGGRVIFPKDDGRRTVPEGADISAFIRDDLYHLRASLARDLGGGAYEFSAPLGGADLTVVGVIPISSMRCDFIELDPDLVTKHGTAKGGFSVVSVSRRDGEYRSGRDSWPRIRNFSERL